MDPNTTPSAGKPAPGDRLRVEVARMGAQGNAVASLDGFTMLVPRGLPGEQTEVRVENVHARYAVARPLAVIEPSPERITPVCADFEACGGCDWLHVTYPRQLAFKREVLNDQLSRIGKTEPPAGWEIAPSEQTLAYRDKLEFTIVRDGERLRPGFHGLEGRAPVAVTRCHLGPEPFSLLAHAALAALPAALGGITAGAPASAAPGGLPAITRLTVQSTELQGAALAQQNAADLALAQQNEKQQNEILSAAGQSKSQSAQGLALTLHCNTPAVADALEAQAGPFLERLSAAVPNLCTVAVALRERSSRRSRTTLRMLRGDPMLIKTVGNRRYRTPLGGFFQVNLPQAAKMAGRAHQILAAHCKAQLDKGEKPLVLDLFCGAGAFSLALASQGFRVAGMELAGEAVRAAWATAKDWGLSNCEFEAGDLARPGKLKGLVRRHGAPQAVLVNPPRAGLPIKLTEALLEHEAPLLLYVSCDGGTFARDVARLAPRYQLSELHGFDLFPHTHHLEVMGVFSPRPAPQD